MTRANLRLAAAMLRSGAALALQVAVLEQLIRIFRSVQR